GLALDGERIAMDGDLHVLGLDARQRGRDHEFVLHLRDVEREQSGALLARHARRPDEALAEQRVHCIAEADGLAERFPAVDRHRVGLLNSEGEEELSARPVGTGRFGSKGSFDQLDFSVIFLGFVSGLLGSVSRSMPWLSSAWTALTSTSSGKVIARLNRP